MQSRNGATPADGAATAAPDVAARPPVLDDGGAARRTFMLRLSDALRAAHDAGRVQREATRLVGERLGADRVYCLEFDDDSATATIRDDYRRAGLASVAGCHALSAFADERALLAGGEALRIDDIATSSTLSPTARATRLAQDTGALVSVARIEGGTPVRALEVVSRAPRAWSDAEVELIVEAGERTWEALARARAEDLLRASEARFRLLFDSIDQGFCTLRVLFDAHDRPVDYVFCEVNAAFVRQTGLADAVGRRMRELVPAHEQSWFDTYGRIARTGRPERFESRAASLGRWYDVYAFRIGEGDGARVAVLFDDVTERKSAEIALKDADRRKDEFIAILAHELRNPLAPLRNALHMLKMAEGDSMLAERARAMMERQVDHIVTLVDDLLDVGRITRGLVAIERRRVGLASIVREAVEAADVAVRQRDHELTVSLPPHDLAVDADPARLTQALANLLLNAAKYTDPGGRLSLTVTPQGGEVRISVCDSGIGIAPDMLGRVFDLFTQAPTARSRAQGGLGIGLAIVRQIAALHGGSVEAASEGPGQGSRFTLRLPLADGPAAYDAAASESSTDAAPAAKRRVLIADDNADVAESLATLLQMLGHEVHVAFDGEQAVEATARHRPDLVLLDIGMPRMDGIAAAQNIRALPGQPPPTLVAVTGWGQDADRTATQRAGFDHHLIKPVAIDALQAILRQGPAGPR